MGIPALRVALQTSTLTMPAVDRARPLPELTQLVTEQIEPLRRACNYVATGQLLSDVLDELHYHVVAHDPASGWVVGRTLVAAERAGDELDHMLIIRSAFRCSA